MRKLKYDFFQQSTIKNNKIGLFFQGSDGLISMVLNIVTLIIGGYGLIVGDITLGEFVIINTYYKMLFQNTKFFFKIVSEYQKAKSSYFRIKELLSLEKEKQGTQRIDNVNQIELRNINYSYNMDRKILYNVTFNLNKNNIYILIGQNGSGKSTLVNIILGLLDDIDDGVVLFDNIKSENINKEHLRENVVAIMVQEERTIDATVKEVIEFITNLSITDFLSKLENTKLNEILLNRSIDFDKEYSRLSGGEKQVIMLLCTLIKNNSVIILDEPSSFLDKEGTNFLKEYLNYRKEGKIIILITHDRQIIDDYPNVSVINMDNKMTGLQLEEKKYV